MVEMFLTIIDALLVSRNMKYKIYPNLEQC